MKIYRATTKVYSTVINKNGKECRISFQSGESNSKAFYVTSDPEEMKGLESSSVFGKSFALERDLPPALSETGLPVEAESPAVEAVPEAPKPKGRPKSVKGER